MTRSRFFLHSALCTAVLSIFVTGCTLSRTWQYPPDPPGTLLNVKAAKALPSKVVVRPFRDLRGEKVEQESWKVAIPFYPYAADAYDRPETAKATEGGPAIKMNPSQDFARAVADELRNAGLFSSVTYAEGSGSDGADFVLNGTIRSTYGRRALTTYMLGPFGTILWILGAPMGNASSVVEMDVQLTPANSSARSVWQYTMQFKAERLIGIYYGRQESLENYATAVQETLRPVIADLVKVAAERPGSFQQAK
ncbi:MAG TPA: hypothetical protein VIX18_06155 [Nitrospirota bacterium]